MSALQEVMAATSSVKTHQEATCVHAHQATNTQAQTSAAVGELKSLNDY